MAIGDTISLEFLARQQVVLLDEMKGFRDEMKEMRRDMREIRQGFIGISELYTRQERRVTDLRDDVQTMIKMEIGGAIANLETRLEIYIDDRIGSVETRLGSVETRLSAVETRLDGLDSRIDRMEVRSEVRFDRLDAKLDAILSAVRPA